MSDEVFMRIALRAARRALARGEAPVGCAIVRDGRVIALSGNRREELGDPCAHAEILAIREAAASLGRWRLNDCEIYVTLEPCPMCAGAIVQARFRRLVYGCPDPAAGCAGSLYRLTEDPAFIHFCPADGGVLAAACRELLPACFGRGAITTGDKSL